MLRCLRKKEIWDPNWFFCCSWWFTWDLLQSAEDMVETLIIPDVFETHMSNAFISLTHRFSQRKIVSSICVLCLIAFISLHNKSDTQVALRKNACCWVAKVQTAIIWGSRKAWGFADVPHLRLIDLHALHLGTPIRLLHHLLRAGYHILCSLGQGSLKSFPPCVEEMLHYALSLNGLLNEDS